MSELNNREQRQETLKGIIKDLHGGVSTDEIKVRFGELLDQVGPTEIADIEQSLINEGLAVEEIQKLCDIHVAVFKESLEKQKAAEIEHVQEEQDPLQELQKDNQKFTKVVQDIQQLVKKIGATESGADLGTYLEDWKSKHQELLEVEQHYSRKENILFPYLERYGITGPPSVMWGIHDEIRAALKKITVVIQSVQGNVASPQLSVEIDNVVLPTLNSISEMIYKEENILFPMCKDKLNKDEWAEIKVQLKDPFATVYKTRDVQDSPSSGSTSIDLDIGVLTPEQINLLLTHLPVDVTFVDENDEVRFFSNGPERIFERARAVIGRKVQFCHPPNSMGIVEQILQDFRSGKKDSADFWIDMRGQKIYIRYFAVRDAEGTYRGTLEVSQNITEIQALTGEKRIYDYSN